MGEKVAFIGLGAMGGPMAQNIVKKGTNLSVYDIEKSKMDPLIDLGSTPGKSIKDTIQNAEVIITMLPSTDNVRSVICSAEGVLSFAKPGSIILDMSTIAPTGTDEVYDLCRQKEVDFIDAPVGRLVSHAISGDSLFMVGCDNDEAFKKVEPLLNAMGTTIIRCGKVGSGIRAKVVNNFQILSIAQITAEALTLAKKIGLDLNTFKEVNAGTTANNGQFHINFMSKVLQNDIEPGFTIDLAHKDMGLAIETANSFRVGLPVGSSVQAVYGQARSGKFAKKDFSALLDYACEIAEVSPPRIKS
ncbi:NAD(P)-dependent oxidoreductase [Alphaproteobacteria bacterium]|jgi:4-hydroxybutyrate dehydrogenase/sulfolactaldehyde 3-reductase|nr:NAD(P)-dependent oxidoreductase [Alphaproteobacteria bacterium]MDC6452355.1 NAD(P)-dependent oxidoreductase [Alphaproteobacteria bacterium]